MKAKVPAKFKKLAAVLIVALGAVVLSRAQAASPKSGTFTNPLITSQDSADPWMIYHEGFYYFTATLDPEGGVWLWRTRRLADLDQSEKKKIYQAPPSGLRSKQIWAPELHRINNRWYLYFTASDGVDENHRIFVSESRADDPWGEYEFKARVFDKENDGWAIDATIFRHRDGRFYLIWCGHAPGNGNGLYIAPMSDPWTISGERVLISQADYDWEKARYPINEGAVVLQRGGKTFLVYSASDTGTPDYALGMLTLVENGDPLDPKAWIKSPRPVFAQYRGADGAVFGPGHNGFFVSPDGREDWLIYHGKESAEYTYRGRRARAQKFVWNKDGTPNFGRPQPAGKRLANPSGETELKLRTVSAALSAAAGGFSERR